MSCRREMQRISLLCTKRKSSYQQRYDVHAHKFQPISINIEIFLFSNSTEICELYPHGAEITGKYGIASIMCKVSLSNVLRCPHRTKQWEAINDDVPGWGYAHFYDINMIDCRNKCFFDARCKGFHYYPPNGCDFLYD